MAADLIFLRNLADQLGVGFGYPADDEEGGLGIGLLQNAKNTLHILMDAHFIVLLLGLGARSVKVEKVEPFFDVESEDVHISKIICVIFEICGTYNFRRRRKEKIVATGIIRLQGN